GGGGHRPIHRGLPRRDRPARLPLRRGGPAPTRGRPGCRPGRDVADVALPRPARGGMAAAVLADPAQPDRGHPATQPLPPALAVAGNRRPGRGGLGRRQPGPLAATRWPRGLEPAVGRTGAVAATAAGSLHAARAGGTGRRRHRARHGMQRGLGEDTPVARPPGVATGTGGLDMTPETQAFERRARAAHQAAVQALAPRVRAQLRLRARQATAGGGPDRAPRWGWIAAPALALALAFALPWPGTRDDPAPAPAPVAAAPAVEVAAPLEQDPDFYLWLASADAIALASD